MPIFLVLGLAAYPFLVVLAWRYIRRAERNEGVSIWAVRADAIAASSPDEKDPLFAPAGDKVYRHPTFYAIPDDVPHM